MNSHHADYSANPLHDTVYPLQHTWYPTEVPDSRAQGTGSLLGWLRLGGVPGKAGWFGWASGIRSGPG